MLRDWLRDLRSDAHRQPWSLWPCFGHRVLRSDATATGTRLYLRCPECGATSPGWTLDRPTPASRFTGPLTFLELCRARRQLRAIQRPDPVVLPRWETDRLDRLARSRTACRAATAPHPEGDSDG